MQQEKTILYSTRLIRRLSSTLRRMRYRDLGRKASRKLTNVRPGVRKEFRGTEPTQKVLTDLSGEKIEF